VTDGDEFVFSFSEVVAGVLIVLTWISEVDHGNGLAKVPVGAELENKQVDENSFLPDRNETLWSSEIVEI